MVNTSNSPLSRMRTTSRIYPGFKRRVPWGTIVLFLVFFIAGFLNWGTIENNLDASDPDHVAPTLGYWGPTPPNYIAGSMQLPRRGTMWKGGIHINDTHIPHWLMFGAMAGILFIEILVQMFNIRWTRKIAYVLDGYGLFMSGTSVMSFLYQGAPGKGVMTALCVFGCMCIFYFYAYDNVDIDGHPI